MNLETNRYDLFKKTLYITMTIDSIFFLKKAIYNFFLIMFLRIVAKILQNSYKGVQSEKKGFESLDL